jgi:hypothetical protein
MAIEVVGFGLRLCAFVYADGQEGRPGEPLPQPAGIIKTRVARMSSTTREAQQQLTKIRFLALDQQVVFAEIVHSLLFRADGSNTHRAAPRPGKVRAAAASAAANHRALEGRILRSSGVVAVVVSASALVSRLDVEGVVVIAKRGVDSRAPFPLEAGARGIGTDCARPGHVLDSARQSCRWYGEGQTTEEDFVASAYRHSNVPLVIYSIERNRRTSGRGGKTNRRIGHGQVVVNAIRRERNRRIGEGHRRPGAGDPGGGEIGIEPDIAVTGDRGAVEVRRVRGFCRAASRSGTD